MKNSKILLTLIFSFCFATLSWSQKISVQHCLTGEYAELRAKGKWSFKLNNGTVTKTLKISSNQFGRSLSYNLVCPQNCDINRRFKIPFFSPNRSDVQSQVVPLSCYESADGAISLKPKGGVGPYSFQWSDGANTQNREGLDAGEYTVTITDNLGCAVEKTFQVEEPVLLDAGLVNITVEDAICHESSTGKASIKLTKGSLTDYSFTWNDGIDSPKRSDLSAGQHTVLIKDGERCRVEKIMIGEPAPLSKDLKVLSNYNGMDVSCKDSKDGKIALHVNGGTSPYKIKWSASSKKYKTANDTTLTWSQLKPGEYQTTITDANGCVSSTTVTLESPDAIIPNPVVSTYGKFQISCWDQKDGNIQLNPGGGTGSFKYEWTYKDSTINETPELSNADAGKYKVLITDTNGCTTTSRFRLKQPRKISATREVVKYKKDMVVVKVKARGGAGSYSINGDTARKIMLPLGKESTVQIMDNNGCAIEKKWTFSAPRKVKPIRVAKRKKRKKGYGNLVGCPTFNRENKHYLLH